MRRPAVALLSLGLVLATAACNRFAPNTALDRFAGAPGSHWWVGDFLVHSGASLDAPPGVTLPSLRLAARTAGLDFFVLLDHSNSTGSREFTGKGLAACGDLDTIELRSSCVEEPQRWNLGPDFPWLPDAGISAGKPWMFSGTEFTLEPLVPTRAPVADTRIGCLIDADAAIRKSFVDVAVTDRAIPPITPAEAVEACHKLTAGQAFRIGWRGASKDDLTIPYDGTLLLDARSGYSTEDTIALQGFLARTVRGDTVAALGGSGSHQGGRIDRSAQHNFLGSMLTSVLVTKVADGAIHDALAAAHTVAHTPKTTLDAKVYDGEGKYVGTIGEHVKLQNDALVLRIKAASNQPLNLYILWLNERPKVSSSVAPYAVDEVPFVCGKTDCTLDYSTQVSNGTARSCVMIAASNRVWNSKHNRPEEIAIASAIHFSH